MKRLLIGLLVLAMLVFLTACGDAFEETFENKLIDSFENDMKGVDFAYYTGRVVILLTEFVFSNI